MDIDIGAQELAKKMTLSGTKADSVEYLGQDIERVVTGRILALEKHPNADKLQVSRVDVGGACGGEIQIVTGATNIKVGDVVPIALDKSRLPGGARIKTTKMRGVESCGMMCSIQELALSKYDWPGAAEDGIFVLDPGAPVGAGICEVLGMDDTVVDFDITYNRADCLGILGIAREAAAVLGKPYTPPRVILEGLRGAGGPQPQAGAGAGAGAGAEVGAGADAGAGAAEAKAKPAPQPQAGAVVAAGADAGRGAGVGANAGAGAQPGDAASLSGPASGSIEGALSVEIREPGLCPRYTARIVTGVRIGDSPEWMKARLRNAGVRPISNIVDITNYVMLEMGQPMHAFDMRFVGGGSIVVRLAEEGEALRTLDGNERALGASTLVIADRDRPIAVAGVMGGANSEILPDTRDVVFESANFDGTSVRQTARRLGMRTESSSRYEKGLDAEMTLPAADRAASLAMALCEGAADGGCLDVWPSRAARARVRFSPERINALLGTDIDRAYMLGALEKLGFGYDEASGEAIVPSFRRDVSMEADLAEEVARFYDYNNIKATLRPGEKVTVGMRTHVQKLRQIVLDTAVSCGYSEIYTLSFQSPKAFDRLGLPQDSPLRSAVRIGNPSSEDASLMRTTTIPDMLKVLSDNGNRRLPSAELFEISRTYHPNGAAPAVGGAATGNAAAGNAVADGAAAGGATVGNATAGAPAPAGLSALAGAPALPEQRDVLTLGAYGGRNDFYSMKGLIEDIFAAVGVRRYKIRECADVPFLHPGRAAHIDIAGAEAGFFGEAHPLAREEFELPERTYVGAISLDRLFAAASLDKAYRKLPKYPPVPRDLALVADSGVKYADIVGIMKKAAGDELESVELFDVYTGKQVPEGKKSLAFSLLFRAGDRTLVDAEVSAHVQAIVAALSQKAGVELRQ
ncbi:MAG: phenylalanine--tRNA ligase subunit beta [Clostridiales bacterium]|nr:phenylalanine--tRNA ligase subunit beta [Clostridiales bacterium]